MWCFGEGIGWWSWIGGIWMLIVGGGIIGLITWGIITLTRQNRNVVDSNAFELVKNRYAKGEITKEEFEQYKKDLRQYMNWPRCKDNKRML